MAFDAEESVEKLDYTFASVLPDDFEGDAEGVTPEPSIEQLRAYWGGYSHMLRENSAGLDEWQSKLDELNADKDMKDNERRAKRRQLDDDFEAFTDQQAEATMQRRRELLAAVCSDRPSQTVLKALPGRIFDSFENYMRDQLSPKASSGASS